MTTQKILRHTVPLGGSSQVVKRGPILSGSFTLKRQCRWQTRIVSDAGLYVLSLLNTEM